VTVVQSPRIDVYRCLGLLLPERVIVFCNVQPAEDEDGFDVEAAELGEIVLDVLCQGQRKASQRRHKRLLCARVIEDPLVQIFGGFDAYAAIAQLFELARFAQCGRPLYEVADHGASRVVGLFESNGNEGLIMNGDDGSKVSSNTKRFAWRDYCM